MIIINNYVPNNHISYRLPRNPLYYESLSISYRVLPRAHRSDLFEKSTVLSGIKPGTYSSNAHSDNNGFGGQTVGRKSYITYKTVHIV